MSGFKDWLNLQENTEGVLRAYSNSSFSPTASATEIQSSPEDMRFLALELVFAYKDSENEADRQAILQHMKKMPISMLGRTGEVVGFDGRQMATDDMVEVGDPVRVVVPGFILEKPDGMTYQLGRAKVETAPGTPVIPKLTLIKLGKAVSMPIKPETNLLQRKIADIEQKIKIEKNQPRKLALQRVLQQLKNEL